MLFSRRDPPPVGPFASALALHPPPGLQGFFRVNATEPFDTMRSTPSSMFQEGAKFSVQDATGGVTWHA